MISATPYRINGKERNSRGLRKEFTDSSKLIEQLVPRNPCKLPGKPNTWTTPKSDQSNAVSAARAELPSLPEAAAVRDSHPDTWFPATSRTAHGHPVALRERSSYDAASSARSTGSTQGHREGWRAQRQDVVRLAREEVTRRRQGYALLHEETPHHKEDPCDVRHQCGVACPPVPPLRIPKGGRCNRAPHTWRPSSHFPPARFSQMPHARPSSPSLRVPRTRMCATDRRYRRYFRGAAQELEAMREARQARFLRECEERNRMVRKRLQEYEQAEMAHGMQDTRKPEGARSSSSSSKGLVPGLPSKGASEGPAEGAPPPSRGSAVRCMVDELMQKGDRMSRDGVLSVVEMEAFISTARDAQLRSFGRWFKTEHGLDMGDVDGSGGMCRSELETVVAFWFDSMAVT